MNYENDYYNKLSKIQFKDLTDKEFDDLINSGPFMTEFLRNHLQVPPNPEPIELTLLKIEIHGYLHQIERGGRLDFAVHLNETFDFLLFNIEKLKIKRLKNFRDFCRNYIKDLTSINQTELEFFIFRDLVKNSIQVNK